MRFDERFDELFDRHHRVSRIVGIRDARYLNWRWVESPAKAMTTVIIARRGDRLGGFLVLSDYGDKLEIRDIFPRPIRKSFRI